MQQYVSIKVINSSNTLLNYYSEGFELIPVIKDA